MSSEACLARPDSRSALGKWQDVGTERAREFSGAQIQKIREILAYSAVTAFPKMATAQRFFV